jgi:two-component system copper resistance phosphate regulon response regulator CusR
MRILLVEDDAVIADQIETALRHEHYQVDVVRDGATAVRRGTEEAYGIIVLDIMLPKLDGWSVCSALRANRVTAPVLMLTARDSVDDRIKGLQTGADDYLIKPFDIRELLARIQALVRRDKIHRTGVLKIADLEIDSNSHIVRRADVEIRLTPKEFALLEALARNEGRTLTRQSILERVFNNEETLEGSVNFHITALRKKIDAPFGRKLIHTVHGIGYVLKAGA